MQKYFTKCKTAKSQKKRTGYTKSQLLASFLNLNGFAIYYRRGTKLAQSVVPLFFITASKPMRFSYILTLISHAPHETISQSIFTISLASARHFPIVILVTAGKKKKMTSLKKETISSIYKMKQCKVF